MSDIGKAYVQIVPKAQGISGQISNIIAPGSAKAGREAGTSAGSNMADALKKTLAGLAIGATVTSVIKSALDEGAKLQQSYGGLETIYGEAAGAAREYAAQAAAAGISANTYAETAVGMGASLKAAFGGDTTKAVEAANMAILDMTDNAAKMGTPIESIQNAYAGFAKGNYTMLDNLKLGYGGTKSEMERLLADATKLTGVKYDMDNLGDVYAAIHAIQGDLGLTGVAAAEASTTFSGSLDAMKAAASNLLGNLALGENVGPAMTVFIQSVMTFLTGNLLPMIGQVLSSLPSAFKTAFDTAIPAIRSALPGVISAGRDLIGGLFQGLVAAAPMIMEGAQSILNAFVGFLQNTVVSNLTTFAATGGSVISGLVSGIMSAVSGLADVAFELIETLANTFISLLPSLTTIGFDVVNTLVQGIMTAVPRIGEGAYRLWREFVHFVQDAVATSLADLAQNGSAAVDSIVSGITSSISGLAETAAEIVGTIATVILQLLPDLITVGVDIVGSLVQGIMDAIPDLLDAGAEVIGSLFNSLTLHLPEIASAGIDSILEFVNGIIASLPNVTAGALEAFSILLNSILTAAPRLIPAGIQLIVKLVQGLLQSLPQIVSSAVQIVAQIATTIGQNLPRILEVGGQLIGQLLIGIVNAVPQILGTIPGILADIGGSFLGYDWASIGSNIISGIANGLRNGVGSIVSAAKEAAQSALNAAKNLLGIESPSKVFRDEVGKMMALGMAEGFEDNVPTVTIGRAVTAMADSAANAAGSVQAPRASQNVTVYMTVDGATDPSMWAAQFANDLQRYARMA